MLRNVKIYLLCDIKMWVSPTLTIAIIVREMIDRIIKLCDTLSTCSKTAIIRKHHGSLPHIVKPHLAWVHVHGSTLIKQLPCFSLVNLRHSSL